MIAQNLKIKARGDVAITLRSVETGEVASRAQLQNLVLSFTLSELAKAFIGILPAVRINALAVGTGGAPVDAGDTALQAEIARKSGVDVDVSISGNVITVHAFFGGNEANGQIREHGLISDNGDLLCRVNDDRSKDNTLTMSVDWTITIGV